MEKYDFSFCVTLLHLWETALYATTTKMIHSERGMTQTDT